MTRLTYMLPPADDNEQSTHRGFVELPPVVEAALLIKRSKMVPGLVLGPDMAVAFTWDQARAVHRLLGQWLDQHDFMMGRRLTCPEVTVGSEAI